MHEVKIKHPAHKGKLILNKIQIFFEKPDFLPGDIL